MSSQRRNFLVTGANKGIGFEIVKKLAVNHPTDLILLGSRDQKRAEEALAQLGSPTNVQILLLDVSSKQSIEQAKQEVENKHGGYLDVLINNAGVGKVGLELKQLQDTFNTNFYGVKHMNDALSPLLRDNGRIVNVSSSHGAAALQYCSQDLKQKFLNPNLTETELIQLFAPLYKAIENGQDLKTIGYDPMIIPNYDDNNYIFYFLSKLGINILTALEARDWKKKYSAKNVIISSVCPGFCATDINGNAEGGRSPELGADSVLHAVYTENLENGQFWRDGSRLLLEGN